MQPGISQNESNCSNETKTDEDRTNNFVGYTKISPVYGCMPISFINYVHEFSILMLIFGEY